jgi:hypothetical protein
LQSYQPFALVMGTATTSRLPLLADKTPIENGTRLYVCFNNTCQAPVSTVKEALQQLH